MFLSVVFVLEKEIDLLQQHMAIYLSTSCKLCQLLSDLGRGNTSSKLRYTTDQLVSVIFYTFIELLFSFYSILLSKFSLHITCYSYKDQSETDN